MVDGDAARGQALGHHRADVAMGGLIPLSSIAIGPPLKENRPIVATSPPRRRAAKQLCVPIAAAYPLGSVKDAIASVQRSGNALRDIAGMVLA